MDERVEAVQRMQEYIEKHLESEISMGDLARVSLYSPWYSYRIFNQLLGMTPAIPISIRFLPVRFICLNLME